MRWKIEVKPEPQDGDVKEVIKFAWLPYTITTVQGETFIVWLERYGQLLHYKVIEAGVKPYETAGWEVFREFLLNKPKKVSKTNCNS